LRLIAIMSGLTGVAYDAFWLQDPVGVFWESCFTLVNLVQWAWLVFEKRRGAMTTDEARLKLFLFPALPDAAFRRLLDIAKLVEAPAGTRLAQQGEEVSNLIMLTDGVADIQVAGETVATCRPGDLVGELSLLNRSAATATVITHTAARYFSVDKEELGNLLDRSSDLNTAFSAMLNTNLANKLVRSNESAVH
jgi:CRP-like cAMP-binding protein